MKKLTNKKGFTIVELVIVIAVIAILAAVLIPTFSSVIHNANASAAMQECKSAYVEAYADCLAANSGNLPATAEAKNKEYEQGSYKFKFDDKGLTAITYTGSKYVTYTGTFTASGDIDVQYAKSATTFTFSVKGSSGSNSGSNSGK